MGESRVSQRIVRAASGIDVDSNLEVDFATDHAYPDITGDYPVPAIDHSTALAASSREQPNAKRYTPVKLALSLKQREEDVSAPFRQLWLTWCDRKYIVCGDYRHYSTFSVDTSSAICWRAGSDYGKLFRGKASD